MRTDRSAAGRRWPIFIFIVGMACGACGSEGPTGGPTPGNGIVEVAFEGGAWWNGSAFVPRTAYAVDGRITLARPAEVDRTENLGGGFVVPAFAEGHTHTLVDQPDTRIPEFLDAGILYAGVMNAFRSVWERNRDRFDRPGSVDVLVAIAGLTASNGHPTQIGLRTGATLAELDGDWVHLVDDASDLAAAWPSLVASGTEIVKIFLVNSEEYDARFVDPDLSNRYRGLDPDLVPEIVARAHADGLRVAAHVRTAADFRVATAAGVDLIAHLPGFAMGPSELDELDDPVLLGELDDPARFRLLPADAQAAADADIGVMTTVLGLTEVPAGLPANIEPIVRKAIDVGMQVQRDNLTALSNAGVAILVGSDAGEENVIDEALYLHGLGVLDERAILDALCRATPTALFPGRAIGRLDEGSEASFVVLDEDPLDDFASIGRVQAVFQMGERVR